MSFVIEKKSKAQTQIAPKPKPKVAPPKTLPSEVVKAKELADTIVEQHAAIEAAKGPKKLSDKARKELLDLIEDDYGKTEEIQVTGEKGIVKFSACGDAREVTDMKKVHKLLGDKAFYELATISLKALDDYLTPQQRAEVITTDYGIRSMTVLPKID